MTYIGKRPGIVTAAAVILFIVGGWSQLMCVCGLGGMGIMAAMAAPPKNAPQGPGDNPFAQAFAPLRFVADEAPGYYPMTLGIPILLALFGLGQIVIGVGLLRLNPTARLMAILISVGKLLLAFVGHAYQILVVSPLMEQFQQQNPQFPGGGAGSGAIQLISLAFTVAIQLTLCFLIILFVSTSAARAAFAGTAAPPPMDEPPPRPRYEGYDDEPQTGSREQP